MRICALAVVLPVVTLLFDCRIVDWETTAIPGSTLRTLSISLSNEAYWRLNKSTYLDGEIRGGIRFEESDHDVIIEMHGNVAKRFWKRSYRLHWFDPVLGDRDFVLSAQFTDFSFCRYRLSDFLFRKAGLVCPNIEPIALYINGSYEGLFLMVEAITDEFMKRRFGEVTSSYQMNLRGQFSFDDGMLAEHAFQKKTPKDDESFTDLSRLIGVLDKGVNMQTQAELESILDVEKCLQYMAVSSAINHWDGYNNNLLLALNPSTGKIETMPWDLDNTFQGYPYSLITFQNQFFEKLLRYEPYAEMFSTFLERVFDAGELNEMLSRFYSETQAGFHGDPYLRALGADQDHEVAKIRSYIEAMAGVIARVTSQPEQ